ncbi:hypothetical protein [Nesterenkonia pannonica]|nr:hypothetical protein [Nesterenkonia pannonica]
MLEYFLSEEGQGTSSRRPLSTHSSMGSKHPTAFRRWTSSTFPTST